MQFETAHMYFHNGMVLKWPQLQSTKDKIVPTLPNNNKILQFYGSYVENWKRLNWNVWFLKNANYKNGEKLRTKTV